MSLVGGETAQLSGLYKPGEYDLAGFAVGIVERARIPEPSSVRAGDVLIGLASSGLHSNGFSLVRRVVQTRETQARLRASTNSDARSARNCCVPRSSTRKSSVELFERFKINGLANITGGGVLENLPRVMPANTRAIVERGSWPTPPIFDLIQRLGKIDRAEMDRTFNNGLGMVAIVPAREADRVVAHLRRREYAAYVIGEVAARQARSVDSLSQ